MNGKRSNLILAALIAAAVPMTLAVGCDDASDALEEGGGGSGGGDGGGTQVVELGSVDATTEDADNGVFYAETTVTIPGGASGANIIAVLPSSAGSDSLVMIDTVKRGDTVVHDYWANGGQGAQRGEPIESVFTLQYPTSEDVDYATGEHTIRVSADSAQSGVKLYGIYKTDGSTSSGTLDFNVYLAGIDQLDSTSAATHEQFQTMWTEVTRLFALANITVGNVNFIDVTDDSLFELQGPSSAAGTDLGRLFSSSAAHPGRALNLFFIRRLSQESGDPLLGISGGVPGPGSMVGTPHSGIVANGEDLIADPMLVAQIAVHETFHYLGLNHTSERAFSDGDGNCTPEAENTFDPIPDTPQCGRAQDGSTGQPPNCSVGSRECATAGADNIMFWAGVDTTALPDAQIQVSAGQRYVLLRNPLTR